MRAIDDLSVAITRPDGTNDGHIYRERIIPRRITETLISGSNLDIAIVVRAVKLWESGPNFGRADAIEPAGTVGPVGPLGPVHFGSGPNQFRCFPAVPDDGLCGTAHLTKVR